MLSVHKSLGSLPSITKRTFSKPETEVETDGNIKCDQGQQSLGETVVGNQVKGQSQRTGLALGKPG